MLHRSLVALCFVLLSWQAGAQEPAAPEKRDLVALMRALSEAQTEAVYVIDAVARTCGRVSSGLARRDVLYFRTAHATEGTPYVYARASVEGSESGEVRLNGNILYRPLLRFYRETAPGASYLLEQCSVNPQPVQLSVRAVDHEDGMPVIWRAAVVSAYCTKPWLNEDCILGCAEYADRGTEALIIVKGQSRAGRVLKEAGLDVACAD